jgi:predicted dehydrogenase
VLIEKPIAPVARRCRRHSRRRAQGLPPRHGGAHGAVQSGSRRSVPRRGRPRFVEIHRLAAFTSRSTDVDVILDLMIHDLDLLLWLDGTEPATVDAVGVGRAHRQDRHRHVRIRFASGCVANVTASRISAETLRRIRVFQSRTYIGCDTGEKKVERFRR